MHKTNLMCAPPGGPLRLQGPSLHAGLQRGYCGVTASKLEAPVPGTGETPSAQQDMHLGHPPPSNHLFQVLSQRPPLTSAAPSFTLFNQNETLDTITAFQGMHTYTCRLLVHSQTSLISTCPIFFLSPPISLPSRVTPSSHHPFISLVVT